MSEDAQTICDGPISARNGSRHLERAVKEEWRAMPIAEQDRAHLATLAHAPAIRRPAPSPVVAISRALQPPIYT